MPRERIRDGSRSKGTNSERADALGSIVNAADMKQPFSGSWADSLLEQSGYPLTHRDTATDQPDTETPLRSSRIGGQKKEKRDNH